MKQLTLLFTIAVALSTKAQIAFYYSPPVSFFEKASTTSAGDKLFVSSNDTLTIYNSDWSLYRTVILPAGYTYTDLGINGIAFEGVPSLSDKLFNSDAQLEFVACQTTYIGVNGVSVCSVFNESGNVVYSFPDTIPTSSELSLLTIGDTFMIWYEKLNGNVQIYTLPGSLPCNQCSVTGIIGPNQNSGMAGLIAYPNPFNSTVTIEYNLLTKQEAKLSLTTVDGKELRNIQLNNQSDKLVLNTSDLPKGAIIASLYGSNQHLISKKLIKIE